MPRANDATIASICRLRRAWSSVFPRIWLALLLLAIALPVANANAATQLWLPTPPGKPWKVIQGYACGTHNSWDRYSLDLVAVDGATRGAPVRAAADGRIWAWTAHSGTLILEHGGGFYTMYTHMGSVVTTQLNRAITRGTVIGTVGDRGAPGIPHLHFTAFVGKGPSAEPRRSVALSFAEGYDLPEVGGCNQHGGATLTADGQAVAGPPEVHFSAAAEASHWYNTDMRIAFDATGASGFSQAWDADPAGSAPMFADSNTGYVQLAWAGEGLHTLNVRAWGLDGQQVLTTYGPFGYDVTAPQAPPPTSPVTAKVGKPVVLRWNAASDAGSGVAGYRLAIATDANATSNWFTQVPQVALPALAVGEYFLRVQALDYAGNVGAWTTLGKVTIKG
jgi:Peptidase family M23